MLIGQPFDLVKIRLQTASSSQTSISVIKDVIKNEGLTAFYKGTLPPLVGVGVCVSLQFYGFHETKRYFESQNRKLGVAGINLWPQTYISGAVAGIVNTPVASVVEQLRILSQSSTSKLRLSHVINDIYTKHGMRGIFRGTGITLVREIQSYGVWFLAYESTVQQIIQYRNYTSRNDLKTWELLGSGALAGNLLWLSAYPIDVIKSNVQSDSFKHLKFNGSSIKAIHYIFHHYGFRGFWKGLGPCLVRATPCSAGTFASVELALRVLG